MAETVLLTALLLAGFLAVLAHDHRIRRHEISAVRKMLSCGLGKGAFPETSSPEAHPGVSQEGDPQTQVEAARLKSWG